MELPVVITFFAPVVKSAARYGHEYSGGWIISSPRNLPGVDYEPFGGGGTWGTNMCYYVFFNFQEGFEASHIRTTW